MTEPSAALARAALRRFEIPGRSTLRFVRHGENTTYQVQTPDGRTLALRLHRPGYHTLAGLRSELAWMEVLRSGGIETAAPLAGADGEPIQRIETEDGSGRTAMLFTWIDGVPLSSLSGAEPWVTLGEVMATIHEHGRTWNRPAGFVRPAWNEDALVGDQPRWGDPDPHGLFSPPDRRLLEACRAEVRRRLETIGHDPAHYGLIHGDLSFENVLVAGGATIVIDFDDCGDSWFVHELAVALYPHEGSADFDARRDALDRGYRRVRSLPDEILAELPTFMMARRLCTLGWLFSRSETDHAAAQRERRLLTTPAALRAFLAWSTTSAVQIRARKQSGGHGVGDERGVAPDWPAADDDEQLIELG